MELNGKKTKKYRKKYDRFSHNSYNVKRQIPIEVLYLNQH